MHAVIPASPVPLKVVVVFRHSLLWRPGVSEPKETPEGQCLVHHHSEASFPFTPPLGRKLVSHLCL